MKTIPLQQKYQFPGYDPKASKEDNARAARAFIAAFLATDRPKQAKQARMRPRTHTTSAKTQRSQSLPKASRITSNGTLLRLVYAR